MTPLVTLPLESYQLAKYAEPLVCFVCRFENSFDAETCRGCGAPTALTHQATSPKRAPQMIAVIGPPGCGKTVYLGMLLDLLARRTTGVRALARGAFSVTLQQETVEALASCRFPERTENTPSRWNWVHCQVHLNRRRCPREIIVADPSGDAILGHLEGQGHHPAVSALFARAAAALVLVDVSEVEAGGSDGEYFAVKALSSLDELERKGRRAWRRRPVAVVFTKADVCETCFDDPREYAELHCSSLVQFCHQRFSKVGFFATSVARSDTGPLGSQVPLRVEPRAIVDPFEWLIARTAC
ncbi:MAG: hypothetical protein DWQ31_09595 [Planctomycetota bacterium]|nr:MAG: hypothetical protein DWQ31_09595 [Planctomycetota bacterium]REJ97862.1 MAG: hypothetical protein DWQ35_01250 [Planctomycetota bacterium]REK18371.1 MAG: hypothetical protein DWQ42_20285 [Planctomycetota bacterium]REK40448.1 MAG: hypothetical protein DWQ46_16295 [Planctomycetota bacterium]